MPPPFSMNKRGKKPLSGSKKISSKPSSQASQAVQQQQPQTTAVSSPTPSWFSWAIAESCESIKVPVEDVVDSNQHAKETVDVHCLRWGTSKTKRGLIFVHGGGANAYWYKFIGPFFANEFDVVAITNSGNGDSGHRKQTYTMKNWSYEILVCCEKLGLLNADRPRPFIVAHSLGTYVTINLLRGVDFSADICDKFGGVILADGAIRPYELSKTVQERVLEIRSKDPNLKHRDNWPINPPTTSPVSRFKLRPFQECDNIYILKFLAESSREIVDEDGSWCWRGDCNRDGKMDWNSMPILCDSDVLTIAKRIPTTFMYGEESILCDVSVVEHCQKTLGWNMGIVGIPCAAHHIWLDQPLPFISAIRGVFAGWPKSDAVTASAESENEELLTREALLESKL